MTHSKMDLVDRFFNQNEQCADALSMEEVETYAADHSGGLVVLLGESVQVGNMVVTMHDTWAGGDEVVVHLYDPESDDDEGTVWEFADATQAFDLFTELVEGV